MHLLKAYLHYLTTTCSSTVLSTHIAESSIAEHRQQGVNVAFTGEIQACLNMAMWRRHAFGVPAVISTNRH